MLNSVIGDELMSNVNVRLDTRGITVLPLVSKRTFEEFRTKYIGDIILVFLPKKFLSQKSLNNKWHFYGRYLTFTDI